MKKKVLAGAFMAFLFCSSPSFPAQEKWKGVDETVVEKFAREVKHPPREPFFNLDHGDLLLFLFLVAGAAGGFVGGYFFRDLFSWKNGKKDMDA